MYPKLMSAQFAIKSSDYLRLKFMADSLGGYQLLIKLLTSNKLVVHIEWQNRTKVLVRLETQMCLEPPVCFLYHLFYFSTDY
jgi:hypothetical protein